MRPPSVTVVPPRANERTSERPEWLWLLGAVLFGAILRLSFPGRMAVEHFDEGVYASNFWFEVEQGGEYPARHLYAPPLLPMAIEWTMIVASLCGIKPTGCIPMIPSLIAGLATIPSMWYVGRRWFGPSAGIVAAWLVAASDFHASYSRAALTDVPVCLFMLWAVYFLWLALQTGTRRDILLAGLFTGLAWWTKYNGWLPLAIGLSGGTAWQLSLPRADRRLRQFATRWLLVALTAFAIWSPVLWGLQKHGGYAAVAANHRQYVVGFAGWGSSARKQLSIIGRYDNWLGTWFELAGRDKTRSTAPPSWTGITVTPRPGPFAAPVATIPGDVLSMSSRWARLASPLLLLFTTAAAGVWGLIRCKSSCQRLSLWLLLSWLIGLSLTTPLYHPYPRLVLPWLISTWLGVGIAFELIRDKWTSAGDIERRVSTWNQNWMLWAVVACLSTCSGLRSAMGTSHAWRDRGSLQAAAVKSASWIKAETKSHGFSPDEAIVYVFGSPAWVFALKANQLPLVSPVQDLDFVQRERLRPTFVILHEPAVGQTEIRVGSDSYWQVADLLKRRDILACPNPNVIDSHLVWFDEIDGWLLYDETASSRFVSTVLIRVR